VSAVAGLLEGKVAIVTGAGRGIGAATARHLCQLGARVAVTDRHVGPAHQVAEALEAEGHDVVALEADVGDGASISAMVVAVVERFGGVDLLDHNAAWTDFATDLEALEVDLATWDKVLRTNATGALLLARATLPLMVERGGGAIVLISSGSASTGELSRVSYGVSKAAIEQLTRHLAARYGRRGVRTNAIAPGYILTESAARGVPEAGRALLARQNPLGRLGLPEDIAHVVGFLLSEQAGFVNGQVLRVDGGQTISPRLAALED
jgi:NAD(P)-dependent dehydrogenase (short-subunit alcohol dehydrogenase family)